MSRLVTKLTKLTQLDVSRTGYRSMPTSCSWPSTLRYLNISRAKLTIVTPCLPKSLEVQSLGQRPENLPIEKMLSIYLPLGSLKVLDLSYNDLKEFVLTLPILRELHLSGNKFLRLPAGGPYPNLQTLMIQVKTNPIHHVVSLCSPCWSILVLYITVKHLEHVQPFRPSVIQTTWEPRGRTQQVCLLLWIRHIPPLTTNRKWRCENNR